VCSVCVCVCVCHDRAMSACTLLFILSAELGILLECYCVAAISYVIQYDERVSCFNTHIYAGNIIRIMEMTFVHNLCWFFDLNQFHLKKRSKDRRINNIWHLGFAFHVLFIVQSHQKHNHGCNNKIFSDDKISRDSHKNNHILCRCHHHMFWVDSG